MRKIVIAFLFAFLCITTPSFAEITPDKTSPVPTSTSEVTPGDSAVTFTCDVGDNLFFFYPDGDSYQRAEPCDVASIAMSTAGNYRLVEFDSTATGAGDPTSFDGHSYDEIKADPGFVSETYFQWQDISQPFDGASEDSQAVYTLVTGMPVRYLIFIVTTFGLIGLAIKGMRSIK